MSIFLRWGVPALVTVVGGTSLAISTTSAGMNGDLTARAESVLSEPDLAWASISFDARDAVISGTAGDVEIVERAIARVAAVHGVRSVRSAAVLAERVSPFPFRATLKDGAISLAGGVPNESAHAEILLATGATDDSLRVLAGAPRTDLWRAAVDHGLTYLEGFDEGEIRLDDLELTVSGRAGSAAAYDALTDLADDPLPEGVTIAAREILPALVSPFVFNADFDGTRVTVSGLTPTEAFADRLQREGVGGRPVSLSLVLASGAADGFEEDARVLLENLVLLEEGRATISDGTLTLEGAPADPATADAIAVAMTRLGATLALTPPRADRYEFIAIRDGAIIRLEGLVPDAPTRDRLEALDNVDAASLQLARGAPERFDSGVEFGLDLLAHLSEGRVVLDNSRITVEGRAATAADFTDVETMLALGAPQGLILATADVRPPLATPFVWSAQKDAEGGVRIEGFAPSRAVRDALRAAVPNVDSDSSTIADGNPANFEVEALAALGILPELTSGRIAYDGAGWTFEGIADSGERADFVREAFDTAGLDAAGWSLELALPPEPEPEEPQVAALPVADPYEWSAEKSGDGRVTLRGYVVTDELKRFLAVRAGNVAEDTTEVAAGEPAGFTANALAGLEALRHLSEGVARFENGVWSLSGTPSTGDEADLALAALSDAATAGERWQTTIAAPVEAGDTVSPEVATEEETLVAATPDDPAIPTPEPVVSAPSFVFAARKPLDGTIAIEGAVPNEAARSLFGLVTGNPAPETLTVAAGLPPDFVQRADTGIRLLAGLDAGEFGYDGTTWSLTGQVENEAERDTILGIVAGLPAAADWRTDIALLPPIDICRRKVDAFAGRNAILFQSGSARLADESLPALDELAAYLGMCPVATVYVEGHTDADGADDLNLALSVTRAEAVVEALIERGVSYQRLYAVGYGEGLPIADNDTTAGKRANRRIAFSITEPAE